MKKFIIKTELTKGYSKEIKVSEGDVIKGKISVIRTRCNDSKCGILIFKIKKDKEELYRFPLIPDNTYSLPSKDIEFICPEPGVYKIEVELSKNYLSSLIEALGGALIGGMIGGFFSIPVSLMFLKLRSLKGISSIIVLGIVFISAIIGLLVGFSRPAQIEVYSLELWIESNEEEYTKPY
ncbi:MAG: hypothetical protein DRJ41_00445 [Thermoprotei archaeon]|nr:MAG: hypothetical protein DRJ41_00445 [Thermoprotei archaeon]